MSTHRDPQAISDAVAASIGVAIDQSGLTIDDVAERTGIPEYDLLNKLACRYSFYVAELFQIAAAIGVESPADLIRDAIGGDRS